MKKTIGLISLTACILGLTSCGMKECKCYSTNVITQTNPVTQVDSIIQNATDTVNNFTRGICEEFNKDETFQMDSNTTVHHSIICMDI
jgi:hypothetical protein